MAFNQLEANSPSLYLRENDRKAETLLRFQGVWKWNISTKY